MPSPPSQAAGYTLAFSDEFTSLSLSPSGTGSYNWYRGLWWSAQPSTSLITVAGSVLTLTWSAGSGMSDTSITSYARDGSTGNAFRYGYYEASMKWDVTTGAWPAFWFIPRQGIGGGTSHTGELDVFEGQGSDTHTYYGTLHEWNGSTHISQTTPNNFNLSGGNDFTQFHTYGALWTPGQVAFYYDNVLLHTASTPAIFDTQDFYIVLGAQEGVSWTAGNMTGVTASTMKLQVDWVRIWQDTGAGAGPTPSVATASLPSGVVSSSYSSTVSATGGTAPYTWAVTVGTLPAGLTLNASTGAITGTPTGAGTSSFTVQVTDSIAQTATASLSIIIAATAPPGGGVGGGLPTGGSAGVLPTIRNGWYAVHPLSQDDRAPVVRVLKFRNGQEQRFTTGAPLLRGFNLEYHACNDTDRLALDAFVASTLGDFDSSWTFNLGVKGSTPTSYVNCTFTQKEFSWTQSAERPTLWDGSIQFRQTNGTYPDIGTDSTNTVNPGWTNGLTSYFPPSLRAFNGTTTVPYLQNPYKRSINYKNANNDLENGLQYSYPFYGSGLSNFPTRGLYTWELQFPSIPDSDLAQLENHWIACYGRLMPFYFIDPTDSTTYNVRYDMASLQIKRLHPNNNSVTVQLAELFYGPVGTSGTSFPNPPGSHLPIGSIVLNVRDEYAVDPSFTAFAQGYFPGAPLAIISHAADFPLATESVTLSAVPLTMYFRVWHSLSSSGTPNIWKIYDVNILVTFAGGSTQTLRPTSYTEINVPDANSSITDPTNCFDGNPSTFTTIEGHNFSSGDQFHMATLALNNFQ